MVSTELPILLVIPITLLIGTLLGGISGVIVAKGKVQAFIATLVTMTLLRGVTMVYTDGRPISTGFSEGADTFSLLGTGYVFGIPVPIWIMAFVFAASWYVLKHTRIGRYIYALGGMKPPPNYLALTSIKLKSLFLPSVASYLPLPV